jgi:hypothetical protein
MQSRYRQARVCLVNLLGKKSRSCKTNNNFSYLAELLYPDSRIMGLVEVARAFIMLEYFYSFIRSLRNCGQTSIEPIFVAPTAASAINPSCHTPSRIT